MRREHTYLLLVLLYLVVSVIAWTDHPRASNEPPLTDLERTGLAVYRSRNCQVCHQLFGFGGFLGPDLTNLVDEARSDGEFSGILTQGYGRMPALHLDPDEQRAVVAFLRAMHRRGRSQPLVAGIAHDDESVAHFAHLAAAWQAAGGPMDDGEQRGLTVWNRLRCGTCHQAFVVGKRRSPDLSLRAVDRSPAALRRLFAESRGTMPAFDLSEAEVADLGRFLQWTCDHRAALADRDRQRLGRAPFRWSTVPWWEYR